MTDPGRLADVLERIDRMLPTAADRGEMSVGSEMFWDAAIRNLEEIGAGGK